MMKRILSKLRSKLKERKGSINVNAPFLIIFSLMLMAAVYEYMNAFTIAQGVHDFTYQAIISSATSNAYNAFDGVKEGNTYTGIVSTNEVRSRLISTVGLNSSLEKKVNEKLKFSIKNLNVDYVNVTIGATTNDTTLSFQATLTLLIPIQFGNESLGSIPKPIKVKATYIPLF